MDVICWNGTSGAWKGIEADQAICAAITAETGIPATTGTLAQSRRFGPTASGASPWLFPTSPRSAIVLDVYGGEGFECVSNAHLGISDNFAYAELGLDALRDLIRQAD